MKAYKRPNKSIQARAGNGRFRQWTGDDFGIGVCPKCRTITTQPTLAEGIIDPADFNARMCGACGWDSRKQS